MLLLEAGASVAEAAYRVGYSPNAFSTAFKRYYGRAPSKLFR
jgi:AraC-like DNA-binding protein